MTKKLTDRQPAPRHARTWTSPRLTRLAAGRAELTVGPNQDASDFS